MSPAGCEPGPMATRPVGSGSCAFWSSGPAAANTRWSGRWPGTARSQTSTPRPAIRAAASPAEVAALAQKLATDLVVVGPEAPLVAGVADAVREAGLACFGPRQGAAMIEGSKSFAKQVMTAAGVPTAAARTCRTESEVAAALAEFGPPYVVKADGLAAGKGVVVTTDRAEALAHAGV